jgi:hypothetical protein
MSYLDEWGNDLVLFPNVTPELENRVDWDAITLTPELQYE